MNMCEVPDAIRERRKFTCSSLRGGWRGRNYCVYSYSTPILIFYADGSTFDGDVYFDNRNISASTSRHQRIIAEALSFPVLPMRETMRHILDEYVWTSMPPICGDVLRWGSARDESNAPQLASSPNGEPMPRCAIEIYFDDADVASATW